MHQEFRSLSFILTSSFYFLNFGFEKFGKIFPSFCFYCFPFYRFQVAYIVYFFQKIFYRFRLLATKLCSNNSTIPSLRPFARPFCSPSSFSPFIKESFSYASLLGIGFTSISLVVSENFDKIIPVLSFY